MKREHKGTTSFTTPRFHLLELVFFVVMHGQFCNPNFHFINKFAQTFPCTNQPLHARENPNFLTGHTRLPVSL
jgi:hypothetical protein